MNRHGYKNNGDGSLILSDKTMQDMMDNGLLVVNPITKEQIQPASIDIRIGNSFAFVKESKKPVFLDQKLEYQTVETDRYILESHGFVLATTIEYFGLPSNLTAFAEGRSSIGRLGLFIQNAGWVDPGFHGQITLELFNASPRAIVLESGRRVGQMVFAKMDAEPTSAYCGKYQGQCGATGSRIYQDVEIAD